VVRGHAQQVADHSKRKRFGIIGDEVDRGGCVTAIDVVEQFVCDCLDTRLPAPAAHSPGASESCWKTPSTSIGPSLYELSKDLLRPKPARNGFPR
jgi:hypothetical protein